jgi:hypothetical protein
MCWKARKERWKAEDGTVCHGKKRETFLRIAEEIHYQTMRPLVMNDCVLQKHVSWD